ncbi:hypothetical protein Y1Q_0015836 [Alligator mississippiensis]|uniref:Uncharacterized protein n=1 Tax=Alligator mississippiensis TaxID=8496 RepID=A0A151MH62_ALLMI|nr:hypothetical protein Y1Q_0015836 [Alligator mississippiensis]
MVTSSWIDRKIQPLPFICASSGRGLSENQLDQVLLIGLTRDITDVFNLYVGRMRLSTRMSITCMSITYRDQSLTVKFGTLADRATITIQATS